MYIYVHIYFIKFNVRIKILHDNKILYLSLFVNQWLYQIDFKKLTDLYVILMTVTNDNINDNGWNKNRIQFFSNNKSTSLIDINDTVRIDTNSNLIQYLY